MSYNASERATVEDLWLKICQKRDKSDEAVQKIKGVAFFFSSVSALERKAKEKEPDGAEDGHEETELPQTTNMKVYWPAISYWIAMQSQDSLRVSTVPVHSALLETGMEVTAKSLPDLHRGEVLKRIRLPSLRSSMRAQSKSSCQFWLVMTLRSKRLKMVLICIRLIRAYISYCIVQRVGMWRLYRYVIYSNSL